MKIGNACWGLLVLCGFASVVQAGTRTCPTIDKIEQSVNKEQVGFVSADREWTGSNPMISEPVTDLKFEAATIFKPQPDKRGLTDVTCDYTGSGNGIRLSHGGFDVRPSGAYWKGDAHPYRCESDDPGKCPFIEEN